MAEQNDADDAIEMNRRSALAALGAGAGAVLGAGAFSGGAVAWDRFDVCFRGCSEVWMVVTDSDIDLGGSNDPPAVAHVIVAAGGEAVCRPVEFTDANATTIPGQFGDAPVVKYTIGPDEKILGVLEYGYSSDPEDRFANPVWCVLENENNCASAPNTPDLLDAPCLPADIEVCPEGDFCGGTGGGPPENGGGPPENGGGPPENGGGPPENGGGPPENGGGPPENGGGPPGSK